MRTLEQTRAAIAQTVRLLRVEHGWTQAALAAELDLTQGRLSRLERGEGSFSAEQLLRVLGLFNVTTESITGAPDPTDALQSTLARHGATHLRHDTRVAIDSRLDGNIRALVNAALDSADARMITALAPVLVRYATNRGSSGALLGSADNRVWWLIENVVVALRSERERGIRRLDYAHALGMYEVALRYFAHGAEEASEELILDANIRSAKSFESIREHRSEISKKWHVLTLLRPDDFADALREAAT